jgi:hypothetical protein
MTRKRSNCYLHLAISLAAIPAMLSEIVVIKLLILIYAIYLVLKKKAESLPALMVISSFTSNSNFILTTMILVAGINYSILKKANVQYLFLFLLLFLPYIVYRIIINMINTDVKIGLIMNQYQYYLSLFCFFYGIILVKSFNGEVLKVIFITLVLLSIINLFKLYIVGMPIVRLAFYIIPLFCSLLIYYLYSHNNFSFRPKYLLLLLIILIVLPQGLTFTLMLSGLLSMVMVYLYYTKKNAFLFVMIGYPIYIVLAIVMISAISNFRQEDYSAYKDIEMSEITSLESLRNRFNMKMYEDRAPIWAGTWKLIVTKPYLLPPESIENIQIVNKSGGKNIEFEHSSHNIFLDFIRLNGLIFGISFIFVYLRILLLARYAFIIQDFNSLFILLALNAIACMIIGSFTGVYVLISTFSIFTFTFIGITYAAYKNPEIFNKNLGINKL